jgi:hypothetical protein
MSHVDHGSLNSVRCKKVQEWISCLNSHTNPDAATIGCMKGTESQSTGAGRLGRLLRYRTCSKNDRHSQNHLSSLRGDHPQSGHWMRGPGVSSRLSRAGSPSITGAIRYMSDIVNQAWQKIEIRGCARESRQPRSLFFSLLLVLAQPGVADMRRRCVARRSLNLPVCAECRRGGRFL